MRRVETPVPMETCKQRALLYLSRYRVRELIRPAAVAQAIWPDAQFRAQGAGAAASRILRKLIAEELAVWSSSDNGVSKDWGYRLTAAGRVEADRLAKEGR